MIDLQKIYRTESLGNMNASELMMCMNHAIADHHNKKSIIDAMDLATFLHAKQTRKTRNEFSRTPYIEHPLRNTLRLLRWGVTDSDTLIASLLHDSVEDTSVRFTQLVLNKNVPEKMAKKQLLNYLSMAFGTDVAAIVEGVTNPDLPKEQSAKVIAYREHVTKSIHNNPGVFLVKLSDFVDNAVGLWHSPDDKFIARQAGKYQPMIQIFKDELCTLIMRGSLDIPDEAILDIKFKLDYANDHLCSIINESEK